jgi:hypothetical protein
MIHMPLKWHHINTYNKNYKKNYVLISKFKLVWVHPHLLSSLSLFYFVTLFSSCGFVHCSHTIAVRFLHFIFLLSSCLVVACYRSLSSNMENLAMQVSLTSMSSFCFFHFVQFLWKKCYLKWSKRPWTYMCYLILKLKIVMTILSSFDIWLYKGGVNTLSNLRYNG